jgi:hypothetical protein
MALKPPAAAASAAAAAAAAAGMTAAAAAAAAAALATGAGRAGAMKQIAHNPAAVVIGRVSLVWCCGQTRQGLQEYTSTCDGEREPNACLELKNVAAEVPAQQTCSISYNPKSSLGLVRHGPQECHCRGSPKATQPTRRAPERSCARRAIDSVVLRECTGHCGTATCQCLRAACKSKPAPPVPKGI